MDVSIKFSSEEVEKTVQDLFDLGYKGIKATITFPGVIPNSDDYAGYWGVPVRSIVMKVPTTNDLEETVMKLIRLGNFEIEIEEGDKENYFVGVMEKDNLVKIAKSNPNYNDFYKEVFNELYSQGIRAYVQEYGVSEEEAYEMRENGACVNEQGINEEAFWDVLSDNKNSKIRLEKE